SRAACRHTARLCTERGHARAFPRYRDRSVQPGMGMGGERHTCAAPLRAGGGVRVVRPHRLRPRPASRVETDSGAVEGRYSSVDLACWLVWRAVERSPDT